MNEIDIYVERFRHVLQSGHFPEIESLMIGGSVGRRERDPLSDIDFFLLLGETYSSFLESNNMPAIIGLLGVPLFTRGPITIGKFATSYTTIYDNFVKCSFFINDRESLQKGSMASLPYQMVFDRTGYYTTFLNSCRHLEPNREQVFLDSFDSFWIVAYGVSVDLQRRFLWLANYHLAELRHHIAILMRLSENALPPGLNFNRPLKAIEQDLTETSLRILDNTLIQELSEDRIYSALTHNANWFIEESERYGSSLGLDMSSRLARARQILAVISANV